MSANGPGEPELRGLFRAQREREASRTPSFRAMLQLTRRPSPRSRAFGAGLLLAGAAAGLALLILGVRLHEAARQRQELALARQVMEWRSPTEGLLALPLAGVPKRSPTPGVSPDGSPLGVLDPGGSLGPSLTSRRPEL